MEQEEQKRQAQEKREQESQAQEEREQEKQLRQQAEQQVSGMELCRAYYETYDP